MRYNICLKISERLAHVSLKDPITGLCIIMLNTNIYAPKKRLRAHPKYFMFIFKKFVKACKALTQVNLKYTPSMKFRHKMPLSKRKRTWRTKRVSKYQNAKRFLDRLMRGDVRKTAKLMAAIVLAKFSKKTMGIQHSRVWQVGGDRPTNHPFSSVYNPYNTPRRFARFHTLVVNTRKMKRGMIGAILKDLRNINIRFDWIIPVKPISHNGCRPRSPKTRTPRRKKRKII